MTNPKLEAQMSEGNRSLKTKSSGRIIAVCCLLLSAFCFSAHAQSTAFTYQGRLDINGSPANGDYDLRFALYDAASGGAQQGGTITNTGTGVSNGLFTVMLDFDNQFFGADRWLEIGVRTNGGGAFSTLAPRQSLTATPYAITAGNVTGLVPAGQISGALSVGQLPSVVLTNMQPDVSLAGTFAGDGAGLTNLNAWQLGGNVGTTPGTHFLGTTDNQPVEVRVNGQRALRVEPNAGGGPNVIGGAPVNFIAAGVVGATISGGGATNAFGQSFTNRVAANLATVGGGADNGATDIFATVSGGRANLAGGIAANVAGGWYNTASGANATVGGGVNNTATGAGAAVAGGDHNTASGQSSTASGSYNTASGQAATVGGGSQNTASGLAATVSGGSNNQATNNYAAIGGGYGNQAWGQHAIVPGGFFNQAAGATSFAAGRRAKALHTGTFSWADAQDADFYSTTTNQFNVRAGGGARFETSGAGLTVDGQPVLVGANGGTLTNLNASQLASGTVPTAALSNAWKIGGNSGTTPGANFLGTTDNQPLEIKVNGVRALRVESTGGTPNLVGGYSGNSISNGVVGGFIGGGGNSGYANRVGANYASVLGGFGNVASGEYSSAMGILTTASSDFSTAMGFNTTAGGQASTAMGFATKANANVSAAMGYYAEANHPGSFVWADSTSMGPFASTAAHQFLIRATGGVGINTTNPAGAALAVNGTLIASSFSGNGAGLTNLPAWRLGGNAGTSSGTDFLGTTDNQPLEVRVNNARALRLEPNANGAPNVIGGSPVNVVAVTAIGATIAGGGAVNYGGEGQTNRVLASFGTVGGGYRNTVEGSAFAATVGGGTYHQALAASTTIGGGHANSVGGFAATVSGGHQNSAWDNSATVGGGYTNTASGAYATVAGGQLNLASGFQATIGGGYQNTASGLYATVPGGHLNSAAGGYTFAAGRRAKANHQGALVLADSTDADFASTSNDQFLIRANGGVGIGTANPQGQLHLYSTANPATVRIQSSGTPGFGRLEFVSNPQGDPGEWRPGYIQSTDAGSFTGGLAFYVNGSGSGSKFGSNEVMRLQNGRVGIGTTSPQSPLHVQGTARIIGADQWDVNNTEGDFRVGSDTHRFKIGVSQGGGGAGDVWMRAQGGTARLFLKTPGGTTIFSNEAQTNGVTLAAGGGSWTSVSDRHAKENFEPVDAQEVLAKVAALPLSKWNYKSQDAGIRHLGPMAQDFKAAFDLGETDTGITTVDADGVALAAIQGLNEKVERGARTAEQEIIQLKSENATLKARLAKLEELINAKLDGGAK